MADGNNNSSRAGMIGLLLGFAAGALTVILSDPDNRKRAKETAEDLLDSTKEKTRNAVGLVSEKVKDTADRVKSSVDKAASQVKAEIDETEEKISKE